VKGENGRCGPQVSEASYQRHVMTKRLVADTLMPDEIKRIDGFD
jgi:hypothetical protein